MGTVIEFNLKEIEGLSQRLNSFCLSSDLKMKLLHDIGVEVKEQTLDRFDLEEDPEGNPWKKLVDATTKYKNRVLKGGILEREGYLKDTLTVQVKDENSVLIGSPRPYAEFHQVGTSKLPKRPFLGFHTENIKELQSLIDRWINSHVK